MLSLDDVIIACRGHSFIASAFFSVFYDVSKRIKCDEIFVSFLQTASGSQRSVSEAGELR